MTAGAITAELDDTPYTLRAGDGILIAPDVRHRLVNHSGEADGQRGLSPRPARPAPRARPRRHRDRRRPGHGARGIGDGVRRSVITGIGVVAPGGVTREAFWESITAGRTATRKITFFDPSGFRSQIAAEATSTRERRPDGGTSRAHGPLRPVRRRRRPTRPSTTRASSSTVDRDRMASPSAPPSAARSRLEDGYVRCPTTARSGWSIRTTRRRSCTRRSCRARSRARSRPSSAPTARPP